MVMMTVTMLWEGGWKSEEECLPSGLKELLHPMKKRFEEWRLIVPPES